MNHSIRQYPEKESFIKQMLIIEERIQELTDIYLSSTPYTERKKDFFSEYIAEVERFLEDYEGGLDIPKVFIGSKVTVVYEDENEEEDFIICFPEESDPEEGCISFLSPVGRQLLLRNKGDRIALRIPAGELKVSIQKITAQ